MQVLAELRRIGQLAEAAPVQAAVGAGQTGSDGSKVHISYQLPATSFQLPAVQRADVPAFRPKLEAGSWRLAALPVARRAAGQLLDAADLVFLRPAGSPSPGSSAGRSQAMLKTWSRGRTYFAGIPVAVEAPRASSAAPPDTSAASCRRGRGRWRSRRPCFTWMLWLKYTKSGRSWTRVHCSGLVVAEAGAHRLENRRVAPDLRVAVHARLGRRNVREGGLLDRRVAVAAIDAHAADVMGVAELNRLLDEVALVGVVAGRDAAAPMTAPRNPGRTPGPPRC